MRPQTVYVSATPGPWEMDADRRRLRRAGDPPDRPDRSAGRDPPGAHPGRRPASARSAQVARKRLPHAGHRADQAHGRGPDRIPARAGHPRALHALRHRHHGAHRDHPRPAPRRLRRAGRHQPAARGPRHSRMRAGRHPRRRQGRLPALRDLADPDHRPRRAQRRRPGHPLRRPRSPARWSARWPRPTAAARSRTAYNTEQRHHAGERQDATSTTSWTSVYERDHVLVATGDGRAGDRGRRHHRPQLRGGASPTSKSGCARPPPTSNSRRPRGCATRSSACAPPSSPSSTIRPRRSCKLPAKGKDVSRAVHKPHLDEMGIALYHEVAPHRSGKREGPRKPDARRDGPGPGEQALPPGRPALDHRQARHARRLEAEGAVRLSEIFRASAFATEATSSPSRATALAISRAARRGRPPGRADRPR